MIILLKSIKNKLLNFKRELIYREKINSFFLTLNKSFFSAQNSKKNILIETNWDNAQYWFSLSLIISALNLNKKKCFAIVPIKNKSIIIKRLQNLGLINLIFLENREYPEIAEKIISKIKKEEDILKVKLPYGFSNDLFYDEISRLQIRPNVDINDKNFRKIIYSLINIIINSTKLFDKIKADYLITSHNVGVVYGSLCHAAILNKCKVLTLHVEQNSLKFIQAISRETQHKYGSGPNIKDLKMLSNCKRNTIIQNGKEYIEQRCSGQIIEVGAHFAYNKRKRIRISRKDICRRFNWDYAKPIITFYSSNFLDRPRSYGSINFLNFKEFIYETVDFLLKSKKVNILIKPHPADEFYPKVKYTSLNNIKNFYGSNACQVADVEWDNLDLIELSNGIITSLGTIGVEATHLKTPVLCANKGWYGHLGFVSVAKDKKEFWDLISNDFWNVSNEELKVAQSKVYEFAGWYYTNPNHNKLYKIPDSFVGIKNFEILNCWIKKNISDLNYELSSLKAWLNSNEYSYHVWKIKNLEWHKKS